MELVIKIPDKVYNRIKSDNGHGYCTLRDQDERVIVNAICSGIHLAKCHGRLIDADALKEKMIGWLKPEKPDEVEMVAIDNIAVSVIMELEESQTILEALRSGDAGWCRMSDNKSLCDTCLYKYSCESSDAGLSSANHLVCYGYAPIENEKGGTVNARYE